MKFTTTLILLLMTFSACISQEPSEIALHAEECTHCKMIISDNRFAAQFVSEKGKTYAFDSIECMAAYSYQHSDETQNAKLYVSDFTQPGLWIPVDEAAIYLSDDVKSPMGLSLLAIPSDSELPGTIADGKQQAWEQTAEYVATKWKVKK